MSQIQNYARTLSADANVRSHIDRHIANAYQTANALEAGGHKGTWSKLDGEVQKIRSMLQGELTTPQDLEAVKLIVRRALGTDPTIYR